MRHLQVRVYLSRTVFFEVTTRAGVGQMKMDQEY